MSSKQTPLYQIHKDLGAKLVDFAGWEMPIQYSGIRAEHEATRTAAGLFDVSHMGEILVEGPEAEKSINYLTCNDISSIPAGKAQYSAILNENGGVVDDVIIYKYSDTKYLICVNASNAEKDFAWFKEKNTFAATYENVSANYGQIALQGPKAVKILAKLEGGASYTDLPFFSFKEGILGQQQIEMIIARTGYTGEDGFEFYVPWQQAALLWSELMEAGSDLGILPVGLGARDTLRLEACLPLHGHELDENVNVLESGIDRFIKLEKSEFIGKNSLVELKLLGPKNKLAAFEIQGPGIARHGDLVFDNNGQELGIVTSGTLTPTVNKAIGLCRVASGHASIGSEFVVQVRGRKLAAKVIKKPIYKRLN